MPSDGDLWRRLMFQRRALTSDGYGNNQGDWADEFACDAWVREKLGGEVVLQERLAGRQPLTITVRYFSRTAAVTPEWRAVDARDPSRVFNLRSKANPDGRNRWIEFAADEGGST